MPALDKYAEATWKEPLMATAPARTYMPFTRVRTEAITAATPNLERGMAALFLPTEKYGEAGCLGEAQSEAADAGGYHGSDNTEGRVLQGTAKESAQEIGVVGTQIK
ncbi:hypothetical protein DPEC_G00248670 [Dallia pectoralis]|uniref:Uncharacterized protein n=1 Tax=Dallia pectoralis TaxID=75939 RepID=A0ACC2FWV0_DALPE|nr:hypothetical protein DPEC_G00248670 [Dallia pectoralis]